ncbi:unnamed protein product [Caretta caretta]
MRRKPHGPPRRRCGVRMRFLTEPVLEKRSCVPATRLAVRMRRVQRAEREAHAQNRGGEGGTVVNSKVVKKTAIPGDFDCTAICKSDQDVPGTAGQGG